MKIDKRKIIIDFPEKPFRIWDQNLDKGEKWEDYKVDANINGIYVGHIKIGIKTLGKPIDDFWFNMQKNPPTPIPVICWQETAEDYRGNELSGLIIKLTNEITKKRFNEPLASDTIFCDNPKLFINPKYHPNPAKRVWEKLAKEGKAYLLPIENKERWVMY